MSEEKVKNGLHISDSLKNLLFNFIDNFSWINYLSFSNLMGGMGCVIFQFRKELSLNHKLKFTNPYNLAT